MRFTLQASLADRTNLVSKEGKVMVFRKSAEDRRMGILLSVYVFIITVAGPLLIALMIRNPFAWLVTALGVGLFYHRLPLFVGPNDIRLDGNERVYERTFGWPWKPTKRRGTFEDVKGICISPTNTVSLLQCKPGTSLRAILCSSGSRTGAQALAEEVSRTFGFPIVPYPK